MKVPRRQGPEPWQPGLAGVEAGTVRLRLFHHGEGRKVLQSHPCVTVM